jgi:hypothetical protein
MPCADRGGLRLQSRAERLALLEAAGRMRGAGQERRRAEHHREHRSPHLGES